jgi:transposase-like protein
MDFKFKSLIQLFDYFQDEKTCFEFLEQQIWGGIPACPHCGSIHVYTRKHRSKNPAKAGVNEYKCAEKGCNVNFTATVGTIFESSKLPLRTWFAAIWLCTTSSKGISSLNLSKQLGITQKSAWFVLSRIRTMFNDNAPDMLTGEVEIDETYVGGKESNKHKSKRLPKGTTGAKGKAPMVGLLQRNGRMVLRAIDADKANGETIKPIVRQFVSPDATILTDGFGAYHGLEKEFKIHGIVRHDQGEYVKGNFHTNNIEGFWGIMKRGIIGVYHQTSAKHLQLYCNEFSYRFNARKDESVLKFADAIAKVASARITYPQLIGKTKAGA